jgi:hypothetical protein
MTAAIPTHSPSAHSSLLSVAHHGVQYGYHLAYASCDGDLLIVGLIDQVFVKLFDNPIMLPIQLHRLPIVYLTLTRTNPWPASLSYPASSLRAVAA